ncbi:epimerase [Vibrio sp. WJH972]
MKTALILGITGNFGSQMACSLRNAGWNIRVLVREAVKAPAWLDTNDIWVGDANNEALIEEAALGAELIVYGIHPAYHRWETEAMALLEPTVRVAEKLTSRILFPGNVYNLAPQEHYITEDVVMKPVSVKGEIRVKMENRLYQASQQGAKVSIVRAGDFIGPDTNFTWISMILRQKRNRVKIKFPHNDRHVHFWSFLPDLCDNTAMLMSLPQSSYEVWHDDGLKLSQNDWDKACIANGKTLHAAKFSWWAFMLIAPFVPLISEVMKMQYLWQQPVLLDGSKMRRALEDQYKETALSDILPMLVNH